MSKNALINRFAIITSMLVLIMVIAFCAPLRIHAAASDNFHVKISYDVENYNDEDSIPPTPNEIINAFCVKLFFIEQAFESRSSDFLLKVFDQFPDKDYLVLTQPHSFIENSLLEKFIKINKKVDSLFGEILFIIHRESLMISLLNVSFATEKDLEDSSSILVPQFGQKALSPISIPQLGQSILGSSIIISEPQLGQFSKSPFTSNPQLLHVTNQSPD